jgi:predicted alpha-1,6-mannanase (GH76 family)
MVQQVLNRLHHSSLLYSLRKKIRMKKCRHYSLPLLFALMVCCDISSTNKNSASASLPVFKAADATSAFESFHNYFYNPAIKLYYNATNRSGTGAIWAQAIFWDIAMHTYERTKDNKYRVLIDDIYQGGYQKYAGYDWTNTIEWFIYDDMMWWIIALARAYEITGNDIYLEKSKAGFDHVWKNGHDEKQGGMFWKFDHSSKNSCINYPTVIAAMRLYTITGETGYLEKAKSVYGWSRENLFDKNQGRVAGHLIVNDGVGWEDYTYSQGTCIGAAVMLYKATNEQSYLQDAILAADYTKNKMCNASGILPAEGDWNEQGVLKAIFAHYMMMLIKDAGQTQYLSWVQTNANWAWRNRDTSRNLMYRNYAIPCPLGLIQSYEASSGVALLQVCPPVQ